MIALIILAGAFISWSLYAEQKGNIMKNRIQSLYYSNVYHQMAIAHSHQCRCWRTKGVTSPGGSQWYYSSYDYMRIKSTHKHTEVAHYNPNFSGDMTLRWLIYVLRGFSDLFSPRTWHLTICKSCTTLCHKHVDKFWLLFQKQWELLQERSSGTVRAAETR